MNAFLLLRRAVLPLLLALLPGQALRANAFFAMETCLSGDPAASAALLDELGYDGAGAITGGAGPARDAMEGRGMRVWSHYATLKPGERETVAAAEEKIRQLAGGPAALWLAVEAGPQDEEALVEALRPLADLAGREKVRLSLYPHAGYRIARFSDAARIAEKLGGAHVGATFNLCHWLKTEGDIDPLPAIIREKARLHFVTLHGADGGDTKAMGWDRLIRRLGEGSYDVAAFVRRLQVEADWKGPIGLQGYGLGGEARENLARSIAAWRQMSGTLDGMVTAGYQGWFRCEGDGSGNGWFHYSAGGKFGPDTTHVEMWPDMSELGPEERFATPLRHADGRVAEVFSSVKEPTVRRHFKWMREYGIDAAFVQRFGGQARNPQHRASMNAVLGHCKAGANAEGRKWVLMYDLSGLAARHYPGVGEDWQRLKQEGLWSAEDPAYLRYRGKPLVALWGLGFNDRPPNLPEWEALVAWFKQQGCAVMLGVPCYWRTLDRDSIADPKLHEIMARADLISPWAVGRFGTPEDAARRVEPLLKPDLAWCRDRDLGYLPVAFPGFSWHNLMKSRKREAKLDAIPRLGGRFLWSQAIAARRSGSRSLYLAMFDEIDEGTAIFKTSQDPPVGEVPFLKEPAVRPDHYLWLAGQIGGMLRGAPAAEDEMPARR